MFENILIFNALSSKQKSLTNNPHKIKKQVFLSISIDYLSTIHGFVYDFQYEIRPNDMKHQKDRKETVENVIGRKHCNYLGSFDSSAV